MVYLLPFFSWALKVKSKGKTVGVARQQLHFLCSDKESEAKENFLLAEGYGVHGPEATSIEWIHLRNFLRFPLN